MDLETITDHHGKSSLAETLRFHDEAETLRLYDQAVYEQLRAMLSTS